MVDEWNQQGKVAQSILDWLLDRETTALVTTFPEPGKKEEKAQALRDQLAQIKESMSEEER